MCVSKPWIGLDQIRSWQCPVRIPADREPKTMGLSGYVEFAVKLEDGDTFDVRANEVNRENPRAIVQLRVLHYRVGLNREAPPAVALLAALGCARPLCVDIESI